ncbi:hypothetical protein EYC80_004327 [Monilinia laxa]|uniref:Uncharacterized protein n=1 Tax=Monilinia laxa TaxID=61186 RepID=A0A5N6KMX4_MONLA|nr:hypothetical protein EYC80_004327 [Monilinia laxa]
MLQKKHLFTNNFLVSTQNISTKSPTKHSTHPKLKMQTKRLVLNHSLNLRLPVFSTRKPKILRSGTSQVWT